MTAHRSWQLLQQQQQRQQQPASSSSSSSKVYERDLNREGCSYLELARPEAPLPKPPKMSANPPREVPTTMQSWPKLLPTEEQERKTETDRQLKYAKLTHTASWDDYTRKHRLTSSTMPEIWSSISLIPTQLEGPEILRNELAVLFCTSIAEEAIYKRCLFFCRCGRDQKGGKVVFGKFKCSDEKGRVLLVFDGPTCGGCQQKVCRDGLEEVYWCTVCHGMYCEACIQCIAIDPTDRMRKLYSTEENAERWCQLMDGELRSAERRQAASRCIGLG